MLPMILLLSLPLSGDTASVVDTPASRTLFDFAATNAASKWQIVNDGVMGGRSQSRVTIVDAQKMRFAGTLSLANNGGFASVRSRPAALGLNSGNVIVARVKGDGRKYTFNLYVPSRQMAFSYRVEFKTQAGQWTEIRLPLDRFAAISFGRPVRDATLDPTKVNSLGILLGDKKPGPFRIDIDWIKVE